MSHRGRTQQTSLRREGTRRSCGLRDLKFPPPKKGTVLPRYFFPIQIHLSPVFIGKKSNDDLNRKYEM